MLFPLLQILKSMSLALWNPPFSPHKILTISLHIEQSYIFLRCTDMVGVLSAIIKKVLSKLGKTIPFGKKEFSEYRTVYSKIHM